MTTENRIEMLKSTPLVNVLSDEAIAILEKRGFFTAPASTKWHGSYQGGLFDHSFVVMQTLVELSAKNNLKWKRAESPFIVGMFHDLCKIDSYIEEWSLDGQEVIYSWNDGTLLKGHGDKSVMLLSEFMQLTEEEILCIRYHMGAFVEKEEWRDYTRAVNIYPNVLWTHQADMIASHVVGV